MFTNEELNKVITNLKNDGISFKFIANISDIQYDTFYYYRRCKNYPILQREKIENALKERFGDIINEYSK